MNPPTYNLTVTAAQLVELEHTLTDVVTREERRYLVLKQTARRRECSNTIVQLSNLAAQVNERLQEHGRSMVAALRRSE